MVNTFQCSNEINGKNAVVEVLDTVTTSQINEIERSCIPSLGLQYFMANRNTTPEEIERIKLFKL